MAVDVGVHALKAQVRKHVSASLAVPERSVAALLLFYAAECALKEEILNRQALRGTADLPTHLRSHDLVRLSKELCLPPSISFANRYRCPTSGQPNAGLSVQELHEAWRYGRRINESDENSAVETIETVLEWYKGAKGWS